MKVIKVKCKKHPKTDADATCVGCGNFFCEDCLTTVKGKNYCKDCVADLLSEKENAEKDKSSGTPQIIIQQQQQQTGGAQSGKPRGSWFWLCFWVVVFFPIAILYFVMRRWD